MLLVGAENLLLLVLSSLEKSVVELAAEVSKSLYRAVLPVVLVIYAIVLGIGGSSIIQKDLSYFYSSSHGALANLLQVAVRDKIVQVAAFLS